MKPLFVLLAFFFVAAPLCAQQRTVTGKVTSEQGTPLRGVSVSVKGTATVASTNNQGHYSIAADAGQTLQFRLIGTALGGWLCRIDLPAGKYLYQFVVDDGWIDDPANPLREDSGNGGTASVIVKR